MSMKIIIRGSVENSAQINHKFGVQNGKVAERKRDGRNTPVALSVTCALPFLVLLLYIVVLFWGTAEGYYIKK